MVEYKEVPSIISIKDLDYLSDMFNWLYGAYKNGLDVINHLSDEALIKTVKSVNKEYYKFMEELLKIMEDHINENC